MRPERYEAQTPLLLDPTKCTLVTEHQNVSFCRVTPGPSAPKPEHKVNAPVSSSVAPTALAHKNARTYSLTYDSGTKQNDNVVKGITLSRGWTQRGGTVASERNATPAGTQFSGEKGNSLSMLGAACSSAE